MSQVSFNQSWHFTWYSAFCTIYLQGQILLRKLRILRIGITIRRLTPWWRRFLHRSHKISTYKKIHYCQISKYCSKRGSISSSQFVTHISLIMDKKCQMSRWSKIPAVLHALLFVWTKLMSIVEYSLSLKSINHC